MSSEADRPAPGAGEEASPPGRPSFDLVLAGLSHRTASTAIREALAYPDEEAARWISLVVEEGAVDLGGPSIREAALISTCNRTEAYLVLSPPSTGETAREVDQRLARLLCRSAAGGREVDRSFFYHKWDADAVGHLYRVASGLDSMVQGEAQILGQVHHAHELACKASGVGPVLDRLFTSAFRAGKRARSETEIGRGAVSVASAACELAVKVVGSLDKRTALVVGAGSTGRVVAQHLASEEPHALWIANRTLEKAQSLAAEVNGRAWGLDDLGTAMEQADVVIVAAGSPTPLITQAAVQTVLKHRRGSLVLIDISIPRNVEPSVHGLEGAYVYDLDALQKIVRENLARREEETPRVEAILEEEMAQFARWLQSLAAGPLIAQMREHFEALRQEEVRRAIKGLSPKEAEAVERATKGLMNKFLHGPTVHLRGSNDPHSTDLIRRLFHLSKKEDG
jgi:glutamyl-tRNA reductase